MGHHPGIFGNMLVLPTHEFTEMIVHHEQVLFLKIVFSILTGNIASETWKRYIHRMPVSQDMRILQILRAPGV